MSFSDPDRLVAFDRDPVKDRIKRDALRRLQRSEQARARQYAHRMETLADVAEAFAGDPDREVVLHAAGITRTGQGSTATQLETARRLRKNYPHALVLLKQGRMLVRTVEILLQITKNASDAVQREVGRRVIDEIAEWDAVDVSRRVSAVLPEVESELEAEAQRQRHERAKANRGVWILPLPDGMARIGAEVDQLSAAQFAAGFDEIDRAQAELDRRDGITRTAGQRRADLLTELPARYLALCRALQTGNADVLQDEAARRNAAARAARAASALGDPGPTQDELALGVPPAGAPRAWQLDPTELAVQLLRVPVQARVRLNVLVPVTTLLELDQRAMRLDVAGHCYLPAFHARALLPSADLCRVLVDHQSGIPLAVDEVLLPPPEQFRVEVTGFDTRHDQGPRVRGISAAQRAQREHDRAVREQRRRLFAMCNAYVALEQAEPQHDPSTSLRAFVMLRDQTSRGIGCNRPARRADLDHRHDYAKGGPTASWNLDAQGQRAHHSKDGGWIASKDETTGVITWTSPLGFTFTCQPVWDPPPPIRPDARIPDLMPQTPIGAERDRDEDPDRPLWRDPRHQRPPNVARSYSAEQIDQLDQSGQLPAVPRPEPRPRRQWGDDGPPPF